MKKNVIITLLSFTVVILLVLVQYLTCRIDVARDYIKQLEADYPQYIDATSGTDAYSAYYKW